MRLRKKTCAALATAVALTFAVGACSGDDPSEGSRDGAEATTSGGLTKDDFIERLTTAQQKARTSQVKMDMAAGGQKNVATGQFSAGQDVKDSAVALEIDAKDAGVGTIKLRLVDGVFYLNFGQMSANKFTKLPLEGAAKNPLTELVHQVSPTAQLAQFEESLTSFDEKGAATTIDGVKAQPYVLELDTSKLTGIQDLAKQAGEKLPKTLKYTIFIGPDDLPRRVTADLVALRFTLNYSKWGEPVSIKAPPASQITDKVPGSA